MAFNLFFVIKDLGVCILRGRFFLRMLLRQGFNRGLAASGLAAV
jgi:hypothetical protein